MLKNKKVSSSFFVSIDLWYWHLQLLVRCSYHRRIWTGLSCSSANPVITSEAYRLGPHLSSADLPAVSSLGARLDVYRVLQVGIVLRWALWVESWSFVVSLCILSCTLALWSCYYSLVLGWHASSGFNCGSSSLWLVSVQSTVFGLSWIYFSWACILTLSTRLSWCCYGW